MLPQKERHGQKAMDALLAEYSQLDKHDIFDPQRIEDLSYGEKVEALHLITMAKEKGTESSKQTHVQMDANSVDTSQRKK